VGFVYFVLFVIFVKFVFHLLSFFEENIPNIAQGIAALVEFSYQFQPLKNFCVKQKTTCRRFFLHFDKTHIHIIVYGLLAKAASFCHFAGFIEFGHNGQLSRSSQKRARGRARLR